MLVYSDDNYKIINAKNEYVLINLKGEYEAHGHFKTRDVCFLIIDLIKKKRVPKSKYLREAVLRISTDEKYKEKVVFKITKDKNRTRYFNVNKGK